MGLGKSQYDKIKVEDSLWKSKIMIWLNNPEPVTMPFKRLVPDDEIEILAEQLRTLWRPGDVIRPWLRRHGEMLLELVHGDWSWSAIASAMTKAGITYRTGKPWTADWLQSDFYRARAPLKGHVA